MSPVSIAFMVAIAAVIAAGLFPQMVDFSKRTSANTAVELYTQAIRDYVYDDCAALPATFDEDDLITEGHLIPSFDDLGLTWTSVARPHAQVLATVAGDESVEKNYIREKTNAITNNDASITFAINVGSSVQFHPGQRNVLAFEEVDTQCVL